MQVYAVKVAKDAQSAKELIEKGWEYSGKIGSVLLFRKKLHG